MLRGQRSVTMFWLEKFNLMIWFFQLHGILWVMSESRWNWPYDFLYWSRLTQIFTLDFYPLIKYGDSLTTYDNYIHSWCIVLLPVLSLTLFQILKNTVYADSQEEHTLADDDPSDAPLDDDGSDSDSDVDGEGGSDTKRVLANASSAEQKKIKAAKAKHAKDHATAPHDEFGDPHPWISFLDFTKMFNSISTYFHPLIIASSHHLPSSGRGVVSCLVLTCTVLISIR